MLRFLRPKKIQRPQPGRTREPWISRRARYPETTEADKEGMELDECPRKNYRIKDTQKVMPRVELLTLAKFNIVHSSNNDL